MIEYVVYVAWVVRGKKWKQKKRKGLVLSINIWLNFCTW